MWILKSITANDIYTPYYRIRLHVINNVHQNLLKLRKETGLHKIVKYRGLPNDFIQFKFIRHNAPIIERFIWKCSFRSLRNAAILK